MGLWRRLGTMRIFTRSAQASIRSPHSGRPFYTRSPNSSSGASQPSSPSKLWTMASLASGVGAALLLGSSPVIVAACENDGVCNGESPEPETTTHIVSPKLHIFIGYDPREHVAYEVCRYSILKHATVPVEITPIKQAELRSSGLYTRTKDPTESTEFSFTRFLTPFLAGYKGWAMFVDCDFLYTADIRELIQLIDDRFAIMCVQHDYTPKTATKMDGVVQTCYPRKNWSSMVLYNCSHPKNRVLTPAVVNSQTGAFLHRFQWLDDGDIGSVPFTWNFLVGHNKMPRDGELPKAIHYTSGGPWFEAWKDCEYAQEWIQARVDLLKQEGDRDEKPRCLLGFEDKQLAVNT